MGDADLPYPDNVIRVTGEEGLSICGPGQRQTLWRLSLAGLRHNFWLQFFNQFLAFQIPDFDRGTVSGTQPVSETKTPLNPPINTHHRY